MNYEADSFWYVYLHGLYPICGTAIGLIALVVFLVAIRDHRERRLFWVATILAITMLGFFLGEWTEGNWWVNRFEDVVPVGGTYMRRDLGIAVMQLELWKRQAEMMFMAQAGLAVTFALALLWWPIRPKGD